MSLSAGHTADMLNRLRDNRDKSDIRRRKTLMLRNMYISNTNRHIEGNNGQKITPAEMQQIKAEIRHSIRKRNKQIRIVMLCALLLIAGMVTACLIFLLG